MKLGFSPWGNGLSIFPFGDIFSEQQDMTKSMEGIDCAVFWGGTDISPSLYDEPAHKTSQVYGQRSLSARDDFEKKAMLYCKAKGIPMIGVCRGAQLMCAVAGGSLVQHCNNHHGNHQVITEEGELFDVTSCHHQMMVLKNVDHHLLAWTPRKLSTMYRDGWDQEINMEKEPEIVYFPTMRGLAIQGHPEWAVKTDRFVSYVNEKIETLLLSHVAV
jgi:gamma-glutamyl-gamma-aminobutyrate hydrolase PuuD